MKLAKYHHIEKYGDPVFVSLSLIGSILPIMHHNLSWQKGLLTQVSNIIISTLMN